jgi:hypothetical protein
MKTILPYLSLLFVLVLGSCAKDIEPSRYIEKSINISTPGSLSNLISITELQNTGKLTITGVMDSRDFKTLRDNMCRLNYLDISKVKVEAYSGTEGTYSCVFGNNNRHDYPANEIPSFAFSPTATLVPYIYNITLPESLKSIGKDAFNQCALTGTLTLPDSVISIGESSFYSCSSLDSIYIPNSVKTIGAGAFTACTGIYNFSIPDSVKTIAAETFYHCYNLTKISFGSSVSSISSDLFYDCPNINEINVSQNNKTYSSNEGILFNKSQNTLLMYPITKIGDYIIPNTVTSIAEGAFDGCVKLSNVLIGTQVKSMGNAAFAGCSGLKAIYLYSKTPIDLSNRYRVFDGINLSTCKLYVPSGSKSAYQAASQWKDFVNIIEM